MSSEQTIDSSVRFVELWFIDMLGVHRSVTVSRDVFLKGLRDGFIPKLDGSSVYGFVDIEQSDLSLKPDMSTFRVFEGGVARVFCNVLTAEGMPFPLDPRTLAVNVRSKLGEEGFRGLFGPEIEFFVFEKVSVKMREPTFQMVSVSSEELESTSGRSLVAHKSVYYSVPPVDTVSTFRMRLSEELEKAGLKVECHHHEVAKGGQVEISIRGSDVVYAADSVVILKYTAKNTAASLGYVATFMPKPLYGENGSGMHVHQSLWRDGKNVFYDPSDEYAELSQEARYYIGGLLEHGRALSAIVSPTVNSYKRLVPGYEAPVYLVWSKGNRSAAVRVPAHTNGDRKRIEYRPPDPAANPYLAFIALIAAGMDGIRRKIDPGDPVDENVYKMSEERKRSLGVRELPRDLKEALEELRSDMEFLKPYLPTELIERYIEYKEREWREIEYRVTPIEYVHYLNV